MNHKYPLIAAVVVSSLALLSARAAPPVFIDVPVCHWASTAISAVSVESAAPAKTVSTAQNAVRQMFEGLQCGNADWVSRFVEGAPAGLAATAASKVLRSYSITFGQSSLSAGTATVAFTANLTYTSASGVVTIKRSGTAQLNASDETGWKVVYASLSSLNVPFLPK
jgi:hypothetical protein